MTNDPQWPERGRPEDPAGGTQDPMQGRQDPMQGRRDPMQGQQDPMQGRQDPMQGRQEPAQGSQQGQYETQGEQYGDRPTGGSSGPHEVRADSSDRDRSRSGARLGVLSGLLGLIALGGVTAGLVASNAATTPHVTTPTPHGSSPATGSHRLIDFRGSASSRSSKFVVPASTATAHYSYTCPSNLASAPHGFQAQLENSSRTDILPIAASRNMSGSGTVALHPRDVGSAYQIVTTTNCPFQVKVLSP